MKNPRMLISIILATLGVTIVLSAIYTIWLISIGFFTQDQFLNLSITITIFSFIILLPGMRLLHQRMIYDITPLKNPLASVLLYSIGVFANVPLFYLDNVLIGSVVFIFYGASVLVLYLYSEGLTFSKFRIPRIITVAGLYVTFLAFYFLAVVFQDTLQTCDYSFINYCNPPGWAFVNRPFWLLPYDLFRFFAFYYLSRIYWKISKLPSNNFKVTRILAVAMIINVFSSLISLTTDLIRLPFNFNAFAPSLTTLGIIILFSVYAANPRAVYASTMEIYRIAIITEDSGVPLFHRKFVDDELFNMSLLAGLSKTLNESFKEVTDSQGNIKFIEIDDHSILLAHGEKVYTILEVEHTTPIFKTALKDFNRNFEIEYEDYIDSFEESRKNLPELRNLSVAISQSVHKSRKFAL